MKNWKQVEQDDLIENLSTTNNVEISLTNDQDYDAIYLVKIKNSRTVQTVGPHTGHTKTLEMLAAKKTQPIETYRTSETVVSEIPVAKTPVSPVSSAPINIANDPSWKALMQKFALLEQRFTQLSQTVEANIGLHLSLEDLDNPDNITDPSNWAGGQPSVYKIYFKEFAKKIDTIAKKLIKLEQKVEMNTLNIQKVKDLPDIKKELRFQQRILKNIAHAETDKKPSE